MTPIEQAILTLVCMLGAWFWGLRQGREQGIVQGIGEAVDHLYQNGLIELDGEDWTYLEIGGTNIRIKKEEE